MAPRPELPARRGAGEEPQGRYVGGERWRLRNAKTGSQMRREFRELAGFFVAVDPREPVVICTYIAHMI